MEERKKDIPESICFVQLYGLIKSLEKECDKRENVKKDSLPRSKEVENGIRMCLPLFETLSYVCKNPFARKMYFNTFSDGCDNSCSDEHSLPSISQNGYNYLTASWKAIDSNRGSLTLDDFFFLEQSMMLKSLERIIRILANHSDKPFIGGIKSIFAGEGAKKYEPLRRIYFCVIETFSRVNDSKLRLKLAQIMFLVKVVLNKAPENDSDAFPNEIMPLFSTVQQSKSRSSSAAKSDDDYETSVFLLFAILADLLNRKCGARRAESYIREFSDDGKSTLHTCLATYIMSDIIRCYCPAMISGRNNNLFGSNVISFSVFETSLEKLIDKKNKNVNLLQIMAYTYLSSELADLCRGDSDHDTMFGVAYNLACMCVHKNNVVKKMLDNFKRPNSRIERGLFAAFKDLNGLKLFTEARIPSGTISSEYGYLLDNVRTVCTQTPIDLDDNKMSLLVGFFNSLPEISSIHMVFKWETKPFTAFLNACAERFETILLRGKAGARCLNDFVSLVVDKRISSQKCTLLDSLLCFNDGTPWVATAVAKILLSGSDIVLDKDLLYKFIHRNLTSMIGSNTNSGETSTKAEETARITLELIDNLLNDKSMSPYLLSEKDSLTRLMQSIISHTNITVNR